MAKVTNKHNIPERIVRMLPVLRRPKPERMSTTHLIDSPRLRTLLIERFDDIEYDVSDMLSTLIGISVHEYSESKATDEEEVEHKLTFTEDMNGNPLGITLVCKADNYTEPLIIDTKTKAVGFQKFGIDKEEKQLNIYGWAQRMKGNKVDGLIADVILRDHKLRDTVKSDYPPISYLPLPLKLWTFEEQNQYILEQLEYHSSSPYECSMEDRWEKPTTYAVKTKNKKRAERVLDSMAEAEKWMRENRGDHIEVRKGETLRCQNYCPVRSVCRFSPHCKSQFREEK